VLLLSLRGRLQTLRAISNPAVEASLGDPASHLYSSTEEQRFRDPVSAYLTCFSPRSNSQRWPQELRGASQTLVEQMPVFSVALGVRVDVGTEPDRAFVHRSDYGHLLSPPRRRRRGRRGRTRGGHGMTGCSTVTVWGGPTVPLHLTFYLQIAIKRRADERTRTADLISLRVCGRAYLSIAGDSECRIDKRFLVPLVAQYCRGLRPARCG
jgi:hypothetical protein